MLRSNAEANVGVYFSLSSMNALAYLTARTPVRPRMTRADLRNFLDGLEYYDAGHQRLISSSPEFVLKFQRAAGQARRQLPPLTSRTMTYARLTPTSSRRPSNPCVVCSTDTRPLFYQWVANAIATHSRGLPGRLPWPRVTEYWS